MVWWKRWWSGIFTLSSGNPDWLIKLFTLTDESRSINFVQKVSKAWIAHQIVICWPSIYFISFCKRNPGKSWLLWLTRSRPFAFEPSLSVAHHLFSASNYRIKEIMILLFARMHEQWEGGLVISLRLHQLFLWRQWEWGRTQGLKVSKEGWLFMTTTSNNDDCILHHKDLCSFMGQLRCSKKCKNHLI